MPEKPTLDNVISITRGDNDNAKKEDKLQQSEEITFGSEMAEETFIMSFAGQNCLSVGNICGMVAFAGSGKSQTVEAISATFLNPEADGLGFKVTLPKGKGVLIIDTERTRNDCIRGFRRIGKRARAREKGLIEDERYKMLRYESMIQVSNIEDRKLNLLKLIKKLRPGLVIIDGVTDLVKNVNEESECFEFMAWLVAIANEYGFGAFCTIHSNPKDTQSGKGRGHLGSELWRKAECMLHLTREANDRHVRLITTDFDHGKNRNGMDDLNHHFIWDSEGSMFKSYDMPEEEKETAKKGFRKGTDADISKRFIKLFAMVDDEKQNYSTVVALYTSQHNVSKKTAMRHLSEAVSSGWVNKDKEGFYRPAKWFENDKDTPF